MPDVGLFSAHKPLKKSYNVVIKYSVEVEGLPVYNESYDVDTLTKEVEEDRAAAVEAWTRRLEGPILARDKPHFSACLTSYVSTGSMQGLDQESGS